MASGTGNIGEFLEVLGLADLAPKFAENNVDSVEALTHLDDATWTRIGASDEQRRRILQTVAAFSESAAHDNAAADPPAAPNAEPDRADPDPTPASTPAEPADPESAAENKPAGRNFITQKRALVRREDNKRVIPVDERNGVAADDAPLRMPSSMNLAGSVSSKMASDVYPQHGIESCQGRRKTMEDTHKAVDSLQKESPDLCPAGCDVSYYAVFDGHNGTEAANMCEEIFHTKIFARPAFKEGNVQAALPEAFADADKVVLARSAEEAWKSGCTALVCIRVASPGSLGTLYVANVGDSESILAKRAGASFEYLQLSHKHKPKDASERDRVKAAGGMIIMGRVMGTLAVARAIGDREYKAPWNGVTENFVSSEPFLNKIELSPEHEFMILACDGLWEKMAYQEAVDLVAGAKDEGLAAEVACRALVARALELGSLDNVTAVVVYLAPSRPPEKSAAAPAAAAAAVAAPTMVTSPSKPDITVSAAASAPSTLAVPPTLERPSSSESVSSAPRSASSSPRRHGLAESESSQRLKGKSGFGRTLDTLKRAFAEDYMRRKEARRRIREECKDEGRRVQSFLHNSRAEWPWQETLPADKMAAAGFYFAPTKRRPDRVKCYVCDVSLHKWVGKTDPKLEHVKFKSTCDLASSWPNYDPVAIVNKRKPFEAIRRKMNDFFREKHAKKGVAKSPSNNSTGSEYDASEESSLENPDDPHRARGSTRAEDLRRVQSDSRLSAKFKAQKAAEAEADASVRPSLASSSPKQKSRTKSKLGRTPSADRLKPEQRQPVSAFKDPGTVKDAPAAEPLHPSGPATAAAPSAVAAADAAASPHSPSVGHASGDKAEPLTAASAGSAAETSARTPDATPGDAGASSVANAEATSNGDPTLTSSNVSPPGSPSLRPHRRPLGGRKFGSPQRPRPRSSESHAAEAAADEAANVSPDEGSAIFVLREDSASDFGGDALPTSLVFQLADSTQRSASDDEENAADGQRSRRALFKNESSTGELGASAQQRSPQRPLNASTGETPAIRRTSPEKRDGDAVTLLASSSGGVDLRSSMAESDGGRDTASS